MLPDWQPEVEGGSDPVATQAVAEGQEIPVRVPVPSCACDQVVPPSVVLITVVPPTAVHVVADEQAMAVRDPANGVLCWVQVDPPLLDASTMADL